MPQLDAFIQEVMCSELHKCCLHLSLNCDDKTKHPPLQCHLRFVIGDDSETNCGLTLSFSNGPNTHWQLTSLCICSWSSTHNTNFARIHHNFPTSSCFCGSIIHFKRKTWCTFSVLLDLTLSDETRTRERGQHTTSLHKVFLPSDASYNSEMNG